MTSPDPRGRFGLFHGSCRCQRVAAILVAIGVGLGGASAGRLAAGEATLSAVPLAQFDTGSGTASGGGGPMDWTLPLKIAASIAVAVIAAAITYFVVYRPVLNGSNPPMPVTLYGRCTAVWWLVAWLVALGIFWRDLVVVDEIGGTTFWGEYGVRIGVFLVGVIFAAVWWYHWRSKAPA